MPTVTFDEIWDREFAPIMAEKRRLASEHRTEAFLDVALTLCGEEVRQMTPEDMLQLDAIDNPFIAGAPDGTVLPVDCVGFIWQIHTANDHTASMRNLWRQRRVIDRLEAQLTSSPAALEIMARAILSYVDRMLLTEPAQRPDEKDPTKPKAFAPEPRTHFLAPLIVSVASDIGHVDPMSGQLLARVPLPRLLQYDRAASEKKGGPRVYDEIDSLRNKCMDRVNQLNAAARAQA